MAWEVTHFKAYLTAVVRSREKTAVHGYEKRQELQEVREIREVRRFSMAVTTQAALEDKIRELFPQLTSPADFSISWKDGEGDEVVIRRDEELHIAIKGTAASGFLQFG
jgi:hypothetical protein